jgi:biotin transporter BioY
MNFYGKRAKEKMDGSGWGPGNWKLSMIMIVASAVLLVMGLVYLNIFQSKAENNRKTPLPVSTGAILPAGTGNAAPIAPPPPSDGASTVK